MIKDDATTFVAVNATRFPVFCHCWLSDKKDILPKKNPHNTNPKISLLKEMEKEN